MNEKNKKRNVFVLKTMFFDKSHDKWQEKNKKLDYYLTLAFYFFPVTRFGGEYFFEGLTKIKQKLSRIQH